MNRRPPKRPKSSFSTVQSLFHNRQGLAAPLRQRLRRYQKIHVICDNAKFHKQGAVVPFLQAHGDRVVLHYLPKYAPECNPIERVWWRLREAITRNHGCASLEDLVEQVLRWLAERKAFRVQDSIYKSAPAA